MADVHSPNTETDTGVFDIVAERAALVRLTGNSSIKVGKFVDGALVYAFGGEHVNVVRWAKTEHEAATLESCVLVQYRKGRLIGPDGRKGVARDYVCERKFYHRDRVAELLRKDGEA